jgi:uncharacterized membrane protein
LSTDKIIEILKGLDLHPVADHFTIGLLLVGILIDLVARLAPSRISLRYTALTLMILGAISAGASYFTGDLEADRIFDAMSAPAKVVFHRHAMLGTYMAVVFAVLAIWRILIEAVGYFSGSHSIYLIAAVIAGGVLLYIGSLGGKMVYEYGVGTALMNPPATPTPEASVSPIANETLPTVTVPTPTPVVATPTPLITAPPPTPTPTASAPTASPAAAH